MFVFKGIVIALLFFGVVILLIQIFPYLVGILALIGFFRVLSLIKPRPPGDKNKY
jgi:hypothetical protein